MGKVSPLAKHHAEIIERIEHVRKIRMLNKSKFCSAFGMKPQTYNNFIGVQQSKPNIDLIYGVVQKYDVNPFWLLQGIGRIYSTDADNMVIGEGAKGGGSLLAMRPELKSEAYRDLREQLDEIFPLLDEMRQRLRQLEITQIPLLESLMGLVKRYMELDPTAATNEVNQMIERLRKKFAEQ